MSIWKGHRPEIGECPFISWSYLECTPLTFALRIEWV
jgi:hypothetical protein